jgi:hypothetical protein
LSPAFEASACEFVSPARFAGVLSGEKGGGRGEASPLLVVKSVAFVLRFVRGAVGASTAAVAANTSPEDA